MTTKTIAILIGAIFIVIGLLGFISNPIVGAGHDSVFHTDSLHNAVHIISGILFLVFGMGISSRASAFMKIFGVVYLLLGILGLFVFGTAGEGKLLGFLHVNGADNFLHIGLGILIFFAGLKGKPSPVVA